MSVVITTLAATLLIQLGFFMWKLSADSEQPRIGGAPAWHVVRSLASDWRWLSGFVALALGWVLFVQATSLGDISLVQPLMSSGDLLLVIMAVVFLKERLGALEWSGVLLTVLGAVALAWDAKDTHITEFAGVQLLALLAVLFVAGAALLLANRKSFHQEIGLALVVGMCFGAGSILTKAMTVDYSGPGKSVMTWLILIDPMLLAVVAANVAGMVLLQAAFQRGRAAVIVPLQLAMANAITTVAGVMIFSEQITWSRALGIGLILGGTALVYVRPHKAF